MQWLYHVIGQAGIFLICAQTLLHFRPKESYEKYLKLLLSVMLLLQLLQPALSLFTGGESMGAKEQAAEFTDHLETVLEQASYKAGRAENDIQKCADSVAENAENLQHTADVPKEDMQAGWAADTERIRVEVQVAPIEFP